MNLKTLSLFIAGAAALPAQGPPSMAHGMPFDVMDRRVSNPQVKGAPYSAQEVTESTQTLADGSHIKRSNTTLVYRDMDGRVRMERTTNRPDGTVHKSITIIDPVAGAQYEVDPQAKTARKMNFRARAAGNAPSSNGSSASAATSTSSGAAPQMRRMMRTPGAGALNNNMARVSDTLGHQAFEGVDAEGTRTTTTIAPNTIGNDAPVQVVTERWYSADLHAVVMSRHLDPRVGETVYRLSNISRSNPDAALFQVPSDVTVTEASHGGPRAGMSRDGLPGSMARRPSQQ